MTYLDRPIEYCGLSEQCLNALRDCGYSTIGEVLEQSDKALLSTRRIGPAFVREIRKVSNVMTPEGRIKAKITKLLQSYKNLYYFMPVPNGYGQSSLDYIGCIKGTFFAIEAKRPGGQPTPRQLIQIAAIARSGAQVFIVDDDECAQFSALRAFLDANA
jgi:hypothetical protein